MLSKQINIPRQIISGLKKGEIAIIPTDTIYGLVGSALIPKVVEDIYNLRQRDLNKPFIILISNISDLKKFNIKITKQQKNYLKHLWPNPISVILDCPNKQFSYLHRQTNSLAFRIPNSSKLLTLLKKTGPLVAPSVNPQGEKPATTIKQALKYFPQINLHIDAGKLTSAPSTLIKITPDQIEILRKGKRYKALLKKINNCD